MPVDTEIARRDAGAELGVNVVKPYLERRPDREIEPGRWPLENAARQPADRDVQDGTPGYYDVPMLKPPVWTWEIETYFFLGGVSAGTFILSRLLSRLGGKDRPAFESLARAGGVISALAAVPCAPLLISDLGDPTRFLHMLRIWKPSSPMNLGSWVLSLYTPLAFLMGLREWAREDAPNDPLGWAKGILRAVDPAFRVAADIAGIPLSLLLFGYTGILLSSTATPVWSKNKYLGALFSASAMGAGTAALRLALEAKDAHEAGHEDLDRALGAVEMVARTVESAALAGYLHEAGEFAAPVTKGPAAAIFWGVDVAIGIALPQLLEWIPAPKPLKRVMNIAGGVAALAGGFFLRRSITRAGVASAKDPQYARRFSRDTND